MTIFKYNIHNTVIMADFSNVRVGDHVEIISQINPTIQSDDEIFKIISATPEETIVILINGNRGKIIQIINSKEIIQKRIMSENQHIENKINFGDPIMRYEIIPKTIQSFLNSEGGYLYIGIKDTGKLVDRLIGLDYDFKLINKKNQYRTNDKLCDEFERRVFDSLEKHLRSNQSIGSLVEITFPIIFDIQIAEIIVKPSPKPWFFIHTKNSKPQEFEIKLNDKNISKRRLDDFYIRRGGSKKLLHTHEEFYDYAIDRFKT